MAKKRAAPKISKRLKERTPKWELGLEDIEKMRAWEIVRQYCDGCGEQASRFYHWTYALFECENCCEKRVWEKVSQMDISDWPWPQVVSVLSLGEKLVDRLAVLAQIQRFQDTKTLPDLIVTNMGYESAHPMAGLVRKLAGEAGAGFHDTKAMLRALLTVKHYLNAHQKICVVETAHCLAPDDAQVKTLMTIMARDRSPGVRKVLARLLWRSKGTWSKKLFRELETDPNPLVREACMTSRRVLTPGYHLRNLKKPKPQIRRRPASSAASAAAKGGRKGKKTPGYSVTEQMVDRFFAFPRAEEAYALYLKPLVDLLDKKKWPREKIELLEKNCRTSHVRLLAAVITDKGLFSALLERLPREVTALLYLCCHEGDLHRLELVSRKLAQVMGKPLERPGQDEVARMTDYLTGPDFFLFQVRSRWSSYLGGNGENVIVEVNRGLREHILALLPGGLFQELEAWERMDDQEHMKVHEAGASIFEQLPVLMAYIGQGKLVYAKSGDKPLQSSIKKMVTHCGIEEFYANFFTDGGASGSDKKSAGSKAGPGRGDRKVPGELQWLKGSLLAEFISCGKACNVAQSEDMPLLIKEQVHRFFEFSDYKTFRCRDLLSHIKNQRPVFDLDGDEKKMRRFIHEVFSCLPPETWISTTSLARSALYGGRAWTPFSKDAESADLYVSIAPLGENDPMGSRIHGIRPPRQKVLECYEFDMITLPVVRGAMFLLGVLGLVDLAYTLPENLIYHLHDAPWLSIYDGLSHVRLTPFGNYVVGRTDTFSSDIALEQAVIEVDAEKTLLSMYGRDPIKALALDHVGEKVNASTYVVDFASFLQGCETTGDVENKIRFFREHIAEKPPRIWEDFFRSVLARMDPVEPVEDICVFRVKPDRELLSLLTRDPFLKKHVIKAEKYHLLVEKHRLNAVKKRLEQAGFFISR